MDLLDFIKAIGAGVVGNCIYNAAVYVVKWLKQKLL